MSLSSDPSTSGFAYFTHVRRTTAAVQTASPTTTEITMPRGVDVRVSQLELHAARTSISVPGIGSPRRQRDVVEGRFRWVVSRAPLDTHSRSRSSDDEQGSCSQQQRRTDSGLLPRSGSAPTTHGRRPRAPSPDTAQTVAGGLFCRSWGCLGLHAVPLSCGPPCNKDRSDTAHRRFSTEFSSEGRLI
ncbi:hypothetical protein EIP86_007143 [Pleurotus ostreatoroseus]|nr:hypothetical protein EIP86_007143 [Pleurotus ostreatoroseus]